MPVRTTAFAVATAVATLAAAATANAATLTVEVTGVRSAKGTVQAALYPDAQSDRFLELSAAVGRALSKAKPGTVIITFKNVKPGVYAVALYHDENSNGKLDTTAIGVPKEGAGFSRDARGTMGPPRFDRASFEVGAANKTITLKLRYR